MNTMRLKFGLAVSVLFALAVASGQAVAQQYPSTLRVPVTFYDFHSNRTNPEFEQPHGKSGADSNKGLRRSMVDSTLDADGKPQMGKAARGAATKPYLNHGVRFWFRDNNNLSSYKESNTNVTVNGVQRKYLDKFRPVYMYGTTFPPYYRQPTCGDRNDCENDDSRYNSRWQGSGGEWGANPTTGRNEVTYAYANSTFSIGDMQFNTNAAGFTMNNQYYAIDSAYTNRVIKDSLTFDRIGGPNSGLYSFTREGTSQFFPLDNRGLRTPNNWIYNGRDGGHNYSYTMELVWDFKYKTNSSQNFQFSGDDDVWVFIGPKGRPEDAKLVMDIGGIHEQEQGNFYLDDLIRNGTLNLSNDQDATMWMFYCERHANDANIKITTNIITSSPTEIFLDVTGDFLIAGEPKGVKGIVYDNDGKQMTDFSNGTFTWSAREVTPGNGSANNPVNATVSANGTRPGSDVAVWSARAAATNKSDSVNLAANKAYTVIRVTGQYCEGGQCTEPSSVDLEVRPNAPSQLVIEATADSLGKLWAPVPLRYIDMTSNQQSTENFYAILRDRLGNWVRPANGGANEWSVTRPAVATAANGTNVARGQGHAERVSKVADTTPVSVRHTATGLKNANGAEVGFLTANSVIRLTEINYTGIRVGVKVGGTFVQITGDSIFIALPGDSTIYVQLQRSDNNQWEEAPAEWAAVVREGAGPSGSIPSGPSYNYNPTAPGYIYLIAKVPGGTAADTMRIRADYKEVASLRFFNKEGAPTTLSDTLTKYPPPANDTKLYRYPVPNGTLTASAGVTVPIAVAAFSSYTPAVNTYVPPGSLSGRFVWSVVNNADPNATKIEASALGYTADFRSTLAHQTHTVRAAYVVGTDTIVKQDLYIKVEPGAIAALYIEPESQDLTRSSMNKPLTFNGSAAVLGSDGEIVRVDDTLSLTESETSRQMYALLRDKWGNYVAPSGGYYPYWSTYYNVQPNIAEPPTAWSSTNENILVSAGNPSVGQGLLTKETSATGAGVITAEDKTFTFSGNPGRLPVKILNYSYTELRVREKGKPPFVPGQVLEITTNDEPELVVQGKRSDCDKEGGPTGEACWEDVTGNWSPDDGLVNSLIPPPPGSSWKLDPRRRGNGTITVSTPGVDGEGNPTTIWVEVPTDIKLGPPLSAELVILTPESERQAGQPIKAEVRYYNRTGLMEEWDPEWNSTSDRAEFTDNRGQGSVPTKYTPGVVSKSGPKSLCLSGISCGANARLGPDPQTGRDTVTFTLYNANDNPHTLNYAEKVAGKDLTANAQITLLPGDPVKVVIVDGGGNDVGEKIEIEHEDVVILITEGEDEFGNRTGQESSTWCIPKEAGIPQSNAKCEGSTPVIVYESGEAEKNGCGILTATAPGLQPDKVELCIVNVSLKPSYAITRDDGDGYLDAVDVVFAASFQTTTVNFDASKIKLHYNGTALPCDSVRIKDNVVTLLLREATSGALQTGWEPTLSIDAGLIENVRFSNITVRDGAAPVIYSAKLYFDSKGDNTKDYIEVKFSENVRSAKGAFSPAIASTYPPNELFRIWKRDDGMSKVRTKKLSKTAAVDPKRYTLVPDALNGISSITYVDDMTLRFALENGLKLGPPSDYINILVDNTRSVRSEIRDERTPANIPDTSNRKVAITLANEPPEKMVPVPNPASPDKSKVGNSEQAKNPATGRPAGGDAYKYIGAFHNPDAIQWIRNGGGGAVFQVPVYIPRDPNTGKTGKIKCQVKVYDLAGNLVSSGAEEDILDVPRGNVIADGGASYSQMDLFWSGFNSKGMKAAPGTYRIVVQISYPDSKDPKAKNKKFTGTVGIAK